LRAGASLPSIPSPLPDDPRGDVPGVLQQAPVNPIQQKWIMQALGKS
jgi:hypothetical protein